MVPLAPPHFHGIHAAERAICTFENNFVAGLASVDNNFSFYLCFRIVTQAEITINLLITSRTNSRLSYHAQIFGTFYFNATPIEPPGTKLSHIKNKLNVPHVSNM